VNPGQHKGLTAALASYADLDVINDPASDINLLEIMRDSDVVYFDLRSAVAPEVSGAIGKMIALDLQTQAASRTQADRIVVLAIDEFQNVACQAFRNIVSKVLSANYALVLANQALGDLRAVGDDFLNTIVTNTRTKIVFGVEDPSDARYFAEKSGQIIIPTESKSTSYSRGSNRIFNNNTTEGRSVHEYDVQKIHANVFLRLPFGKSVIFRRGQLAVLANRAHMVGAAEKDRLERLPYPVPEKTGKRGQNGRTAAQEIDRLKREILEHYQSLQRPSQGENTGVESEDFAM